MENVIAEDQLIVFVKLPLPGKVKTRLAKTVGGELATALYRCFVLDTLATARQAGYPVAVFFHPPDAGNAFADWLGNDIACFPQEGEDLGERMLAAFQRTLRTSSRAVLIGSDCPDLPPSFIQEAFEALRTHNAVLGPAGDGGYYLIGFSSEGLIDPRFIDVEWGSRGVFEATLALFKKNNLTVHVLPCWNDLDEYEDLKAFYDRQKTAPYGALSTIDFLREHFGW